MLVDRELARIVKVDCIRPHTNADRLEIAMVGGWQTVVQKGKFIAGDLALYLEIDAMAPVENTLFNFLTERLSTINGVVYSRIKTIKLRKELSQGVLIPLIKAPIQDRIIYAIPFEDEGHYLELPVSKGLDLTEKLGVIKYTPPHSFDGENVTYTGFFGVIAKWIRGNINTSNLLPWPEFIPKSYQDRIQNITGMYAVALRARTLEEFEVTYKLNGKSMTVYCTGDQVGLTGRNTGILLDDTSWPLSTVFRVWTAEFIRRLPRMIKKRKLLLPKWKISAFDANDLMIKTAYKENIFNKLKNYFNQTGLRLAVQGELCGPDIAGNPEKLDEVQFFIYDIYQLSKKGFPIKSFPPHERIKLIEELGLTPVPIFNYAKLPLTVTECLTLADGPSFNGKGIREGLVFKSCDYSTSFKVVSNRFLLDHPEE